MGWGFKTIIVKERQLTKFEVAFDTSDCKMIERHKEKSKKKYIATIHICYFLPFPPCSVILFSDSNIKTVYKV